MTEYVTGGTVQDGKLKIRNKQQFEDAMRSFHGEVFVTVEKAHANISELQRRYYFGLVLGMFAEETGNTVKELHEWAKAKFIPWEVSICDGNGHILDGRVVGGSITKLNRVTFGELIENVRQFMATELGIITPDPDPDWREKKDAEQAEKIERGRQWAKQRQEHA